MEQLLFGLAILILTLVILRRAWRALGRIRARILYQRYVAERSALIAAGTYDPKPSAKNDFRHWKQEREAELAQVKDKDTRVTGLAEPQGFWSRFVMGEKIAFLREMIRLGNSEEHQGYWTDYIKAQSRAQGQDRGQGTGRGQ